MTAMNRQLALSLVQRQLQRWRRLGVRAHILKGGDFLRISVKRQGVRYLIHLPVVNETRINRPAPSPQ